jgi:hypothetical protein
MRSRPLLQLCLACLLLVAGPVRADEDDDRRREDDAEKAGVPRMAVSKAIDTGAAYLLKKFERDFDKVAWNSTLELVMLTLAHAGVQEDDPGFARGLRALETCKLQYTYRVAGLAMALQRIDAWKYRRRIAHCAQWLVDTQLADGEWGYPRSLRTPTEVPRPVEVPEPPEAETIVTEPPKDGYATPTVRVRKRPHEHVDIKGVGDISNTQFAILGLKACHDAEIQIPKATWKAALSYISKFQNRDGGWGYAYAGMRDKASYASMTCAGVVSVAICRLGLGAKSPERHGVITKGMKWLARHFAVDRNHNIENSHVADPLRWRFYYLYSIERVGQVIGVDELGDKAWYPLGARYLLDQQKPDGSWWTGIPGDQWRQAGDIETADTCFAILFLTRSTPSLIRPVVTGN